MSFAAASMVPPYDRELRAALPLPAANGSITADMIGALRATSSDPNAWRDKAGGFRRLDASIPVTPTISIALTVFNPIGGLPLRPCLLYIHGGGMILGDRLGGIEDALDLAMPVGATVATVEYRLAPEHPDPIPVSDCLAAFRWLRDVAQEIGFSPTKIIAVGYSAGGGLAAGLSLLLRDTGDTTLAGTLLVYPMLDESNSTLSSAQHFTDGIWDRTSNDTGWDALLGDRRHTAQVSVYASPSRATDLTRLPPSYLEVGSAEIFRDEVVEYASRMWASGGEAELHVWAGAFHGFDGLVPTAEVSQRARRARAEWLSRRVADLSERA